MAPYSGVKPGSGTEKKIERCTKKVMAENPSWSKSRAIATCRSTIEKKEVGTMPKTRKGLTARQRRKVQRKELENQAPDIEEETIEEELEEAVLDEPETLPDIPEEILGEEYIEPDEEEIANIIAEGGVEEPEEEPDELELVHEDDDFEFEAPDEVEEMSMAELVEELIEIEEEVEEEKLEEKSFDYDLAYIEMLLKMDSNTPMENFKAVLSSASRNKLSDSSFALVYTTKDGKKVRKYPIHDKAHVRNALSRAAQQIKGGGEGASDARKALSKIRAAAKKFGIGQPSKKNAHALIVEKDRNGDYRWVGWASGKYIDRVGDIISEEAHKEFVKYHEDNPDWKVMFRCWHVIGSERTHPADAIIYKNGFTIMSGKLEPDEAQPLLKTMAKRQVGMSIGFLPLEHDPDNPKIITKYRCFEVSDLPSDKAAFPFSDFSVLVKEKSMNKDIEYLKSAMGEENFQKLLEDTKLKESVLDSYGIPSKEFDASLDKEEEEVETQEENTEEKELSPEVKSLLIKELGLEGVDMEALKQAAATLKVFPSFVEELFSVKEQLKEKDVELKETKKSAEEQLADFLEKAPLRKSTMKDLRASESKDNLVTKKDEKEFHDPEHENHWLANMMGVEPLPVPEK